MLHFFRRVYPCLNWRYGTKYYITFDIETMEELVSPNLNKKNKEKSKNKIKIKENKLGDGT
jgi:hypothetical protein